MKPTPGGGLLLHRHVPPLTRRYMAYFCSGVLSTEIKASSAKRGRPREFDEGEVLDAVLGVFWQKGFSGATLPDLSDAAGITRPSLYTALGDKLSMYLRSLEHFKEGLRGQLKASLDPSRSIAEGLMNFYTATINLYLSDPQRPRGCLVFCTAPVESIEQPEIKAALLDVLTVLDEAFESRFRAATQNRESDTQINPMQKAAIASAIMHSLALRARAGQKREALLNFASAATSMLVGRSSPVIGRGRR